MEGGPEQILPAVELLAGARFSEENILFLHDAESWRERRRALGVTGGPFARTPDLPAWHRREAWSREREGRWHAALWHLERLHEEGANEALRQARLCRAYREMNEPEPALAAAARAINLAPDSHVPYYNRGLIYSRLGQWDCALADYGASLERNRTDWRVWFERAWVYAERGSHKQALADLERAAALPEAHPEVWSARALLYLATADDAAYRKTCADLLTSTTQGHPFLTVTWLEYQRQAYHFLTTTVERVEPMSPEEWNAQVAWICALGRGGVADYAPLIQRMQNRSGGHLVTAITDLGKTTATQFMQNPRGGLLVSYPFTRAHGAALYRAGQFEAALKGLTRALELRPQPSPATWLLLALTNQRLNRPDDARQWYGKATAWIKEAKEAKSEAGAVGPAWDRLPWTERLALTLLQREAEDLIRGDPSKP
jgi:tetratricopeptide (TPR) repeat protein